MTLLLERPTLTTTGISLFGCDDEEAALVRRLAPELGVTPLITAAPLSEATVDLAAGHRCVSVDHRTPISPATLLRLSDAGVRHLSTRSVGCNHIDVEHARSLGLTVETVAYSPDSVADFTLMLILMALRDARGVLRAGEAHDWRLPAGRGRELRDLTIGVIGTGRIGSAVLTRLRAFGGHLLAHDPHPDTATQNVTLELLLQRCDVVTLHAPLTASSQHLLDAERIALMKPGAIVVNTGRGGLIDTEALTCALEEGHLGGAALDVLEGEEDFFYADHGRRAPRHPQLARLHRLPHVLLTPHIAYRTDRALADTVEASLRSSVEFDRSHARG